MEYAGQSLLFLIFLAFSPSSTRRRIVQQPMDVCKPNSPGQELSNQQIRISPSPSAHLQLPQPDFSQNYLQLSGT
jgi:hypothetical protein